MKKSNFYPGFLWVCIALQGVMFGFFSRLDPDPYHDGFIYAPAVGISEGQLPHRDVFAQYGPVSPLIQGLWLKATSPTIFSLKMLNTVFVIFIAIILVQVLKRKIRIEAAQLLALAWLSWFAASMPWPSIITTLFTLIAFSILLMDGNTGRIRLFFAALLLVLAIFTRIQSVLFLFALVPLYILEKNQERRQNLKLFFFSANLILIVGIILLGHNNMLSGYAEQSIRWSSEAYSKVELSKSFITSFVWFPTSLVGVTIIAFLLHRFEFNRFIRLALILIFPSILVFLDHQSFEGDVTLENPSVLLVYSARSYIHFTGYAFASAVIVCGLFWAHSILKRKPLNGQSILASIWGLLVLTQLWPLHDDIHVWFIAPILITAVVFGLPSGWDVFSKHYRTISLLALFSISASIAHNYTFMKVERSAYSNFGMRGLYGDPQQVDFVDSTIKAIESKSLTRPFKNLCTHGFYSILEGKYSVSDGQYAANSRLEYVDWYPSFPKEKQNPSFYFYCGLSYDEFLAIPNPDKLLVAIGNEKSLEKSSSINILYRDILPRNFLRY